MKGVYYGKPKVKDQEWVQYLLLMDSFTTVDVKRVCQELDGPNGYGPDIVNRLRNSADLELEVLGPAGEGYHRLAKRYRLRLK